MNLQIAANRLSVIAKKEASEEGGSGLSVTVAVISAADAMLKDDITANKVCIDCPSPVKHTSTPLPPELSVQAPDNTMNMGRQWGSSGQRAFWQSWHRGAAEEAPACACSPTATQAAWPRLLMGQHWALCAHCMRPAASNMPSALRLAPTTKVLDDRGLQSGQAPGS